MLSHNNASSVETGKFSTTSPGLILTTSANGEESSEPTPPYWDPITTGFLSATMIIFMICAIFGNAMVVLVIARHKGMRTRTNMFLCNLAVADFLTAILLMPVALVTVLRGEWVFGDIFCQINGFLMPLFFVTSIHTLMYISIHKYVTITRPFARCMSRRRILILIAAAWLWALLTGYVTVHGLNTVLYKPTTTQCGPSYPKDLKGYLHPLYICLTCYLIPFITMTFCYIRIFQEMRAHSSRMERNSNLEKDMLFRQQRRITVTLIVVLVVFVVSWTPYILYSFYVSALKDKKAVSTNANAISYWFGYMNSACNPIIYALRSKAFRDGYKELWCRMPFAPISEATEPADQHSTLQRLQAFIHNSLRIRGSLSTSSFAYQSPVGQPGSRKVSAGSIANLMIRPLNRKVSTGSLPETFRYATASLPRATRERRNIQSLAPLRHSAAYYPDSTKLLGDAESEISKTNGFIKVEEEDMGKCESPKVKMNGDMHLFISPTEPVGNDVVDKEDIPRIDDDNVFVVTADMEEPLHKEEPIETPSGQVMQDEGAQPGSTNYKRRFQSCKSVSVMEPKKDEEDAQLNRASSEANLQKTASPGFLRSFLKSLHTRKRRSLSSPRRKIGSREEDIEQQSQDRKERMSLIVPAWRSLLRSHSEDVRGKEEGEVVDTITKAASETHMLERQNKEKDSHRWWQKKPKRPGSLDIGYEHEMSVTSVSQIEEESVSLQRTWSEKPRLLRSLSIEKLDQHSHKRSKSFTPSRKKRRKRASKLPTENSRQKLILTPQTPINDEAELVMASAILKPGSQSMKDRSSSHIIDSSALRRSWSDPCMTFQLLEHKVSVRHQIRKQRQKAGKSIYPQLQEMPSAKIS